MGELAAERRIGLPAADRSGSERSERRSKPPANRDEKTTPSDKPDSQDKPGSENSSGSESDDGDESGGSRAEGEPDEKPEKPKNPPIYKRPLFWIIAAVVLILGIVVGIVWWLHARAHETTDDAFIQADMVTISPQVAGHVSSRNVVDNQWVNAGDLIVQIDPRDFQAQLNQAKADEESSLGQIQQAGAQVHVYEAQVAQAKADVAAAAASDRQAENDLQRYKDVQAGAVSRQQVDAATANARTSSANLEAARQKQRAAEAQVSYARSQVTTAAAQSARAAAAVVYAQTQLSYTEVKAPCDGRVTNRSVENGQYVEVGQALLALVPRDVYVIANYKETQLVNMRPGQPVEVSVDAFPHHKFKAHVDSIQAGSGAAFSLLPAENATGNYVKVVQRVPVKIVFDSVPQELLGPGMSVEPDVRVR